MIPIFVLDACALLAILANEDGADAVVKLYNQAQSGDIVLKMHKINLLEVYYGIYRKYGESNSTKFIEEINHSPISIVHDISDEVFVESGRLKATYKLSLADSIALAESITSNATLITADHHEFDMVEQQENIKILWIR